MQQELPGTLKVLTVWLLIGAAIFLGIQWWQRESTQTRFKLDGEVVELQRGRDGHYHWPGSVNGQAVDFLVDTGASGTAISAGLARELGLESMGVVQSQTAGGSAVGKIVVADLALHGGVRIDRMRLIALPALGERPLLGMDVLGRLRWQQVDGVLRVDLSTRR
ncbi:retropepsin-like aspartic protease family protein [Aquabacterium sp.]|uniref:retropepsin-like aspartic protease family protein n=1 Tax=Aquabacterium sp. TaxID=1872578 RepID=UPI002BEA60BC|nr:retropepsin-like aspartic protease [Aquabacterium sp.]HSW03821.1 retropepsin-like aspartic protease [Aquabacterium sp.]